MTIKNTDHPAEQTKEQDRRCPFVRDGVRCAHPMRHDGPHHATVWDTRITIRAPYEPPAEQESADVKEQETCACCGREFVNGVCSVCVRGCSACGIPYPPADVKDEPQREDAQQWLKPCPFCGFERPSIRNEQGPYAGLYFVECSSCGAASPYGESVIDAGDRWNLRTSVVPPSAPAEPSRCADCGGAIVPSERAKSGWKHENTAFRHPAEPQPADVKAACPRCGALQDDFDGFGVLRCEKCGFCSHASVDGNRCSLCGADVKADPQTCAPYDADEAQRDAEFFQNVADNPDDEFAQAIPWRRMPHARLAATLRRYCELLAAIPTQEPDVKETQTDDATA